MNQLRKEKQEFLKTMVPGWDKLAKEREDKWKVVVMN
jgi:formate-dependent nitrite reductase cytochrome c552 subunit